MHRTWNELVYVACGLPLGMFWLILLATALAVGLGTSIVFVVGLPVLALRVVEHVTEGLMTPRLQATRNSAGALHLRASCPVGLSSPDCSVDYQIEVPDGISVLASSGAGDITARGLTSCFTLRLRSGAGDIDATRISAPAVNLSSGAGDITTQLSQPAGRLAASSGSGDVDLTVPNVAYDVHTSSGDGTVTDSTVNSDPASRRSINATSGAGDVTIAVNHTATG